MLRPSSFHTRLRVVTYDGERQQGVARRKRETDVNLAGHTQVREKGYQDRGRDEEEGGGCDDVALLLCAVEGCRDSRDEDSRDVARDAWSRVRVSCRTVVQVYRESLSGCGVSFGRTKAEERMLQTVYLTCHDLRNQTESSEFIHVGLQYKTGPAAKENWHQLWTC